jgi:lysophospholipase L1-like esterase
MEYTSKALNFVLFGDSISKGVVFDEQKRKYVTIKENYASILQQKIKGNLCNVGRFGNTITRGIDRIETDVLKYNPDIVLIEFGGNDCDFNWDEIAKNPNAEYSPKTDFNIFQKSLNYLVDFLKNHNVIPVLMSLPPIDAERYFNTVSHKNEENAANILKWLGSKNKIYWWHERYNSAILSASQTCEAPLIDVRSAFLQYPDYTQFICEDGIHPNEMGHKIIANGIINYISDYYSFLLK